MDFKEAKETERTSGTVRGTVIYTFKKVYDKPPIVKVLGGNAVVNLITPTSCAILGNGEYTIAIYQIS